MIKNLWCMGQAALAISLFLSIGGPNLRADDVQLIDCRTDGTGAGAHGHAGNRAGFIDPTLGMGDCDACQGGAVRRGHGRHGAGCGCDVCRGYGRGGHGRHGYGHGGYGRHGRGGYVDNLYAQGHGGRGGYGADGCPTCRHGHRHGHGDCDACRGGSAGNGLAGNGCDNGQCNGGCRGGGCLGGGCYKPVNGWYRDPRDSEVYSAVGYNVPVAVPLPPVVKYQYQYGWGIPASRLTRVTNTYQRYYPYEQFTQKGGRIPGGPPVIYHPTDTTQQGFYSVHAPRWVPVKRINSIGYHYGR
jgi:hypothetical protein